MDFAWEVPMPTRQIATQTSLSNDMALTQYPTTVSPLHTFSNYSYPSPETSEPFFSTISDLDTVKEEPLWDVPKTSLTRLSRGQDSTQPTNVVASPPKSNHCQLDRSRRKSSSISMASSSTSTTSTDLSREKNRIAATKCRKKKKEEEHELEERRRMLQMQNTILAESVSSLREEVLSLKSEILRHGTCEFPPIKSYIETAASRMS